MTKHDFLFGGVGIGTFPFASPFTPVSHADKIAILDEYFRRGGKYIDTAPTYGLGAVENFLGDALTGRPRDSFAISTSCGYVIDPVTSAVTVSGRRDDIIADLEASLRRLKVDFIDVYISHVPDPSTPKAETAATLADLKRQGVVRRIGVANVNATQLREYADAAQLDLLHQRLSYLNRRISPDVAQLCSERGISIVAYQVLERGILTDRGVDPAALGDDDLRRRKPEFATVRLSAINDLIAACLRPLSSRHDLPIEDLVVRWCLAQPGVVLAQIGITRATQLKSLPLGNSSVSASLMADLELAFAEITQGVAALGYADVRDAMGLDAPTPQSATGR